MTSGFIKLHRKILEWEWFDDDKVFKLFVFILIKANHKPKRWQGIDIDRGQFLTSLDKLAKGTGMSVQMVRTALAKLQSTNEITNRSTKRFRMITVENYSQYQARQDDEQQSEQQSEQQTINKAPTTTKNVKNVKKKDIWRPPSIDEVTSYFSEKGVNSGEPQKFYDHHLARDWVLSNGRKMKDWKAASRTWISNINKFQPRGNNNGPTQFEYL